MSVTYQDAGVDTEVADQFVGDIKQMAQRTHRPEVMQSIGGFSGLFSFPTHQYKNPVLVSSTDGVGTKLKIAALTGNHKTIGIDLVAMCVNDIVVCGAEPLFFLDYFATGHLNPDQGKDIIAGVIDGCKQAGCALLGGETAEMPGLYNLGDYDLAGFAVGVVERDKLLGSHKVKQGDLLLGFSSNGLHSNGFSLVRKVLLSDNQTSLDKIPKGLTTSLGEELLRPTRIYVKPVLDMIEQANVHALAHITGGGLKDNLPRVIPDDLAVQVDWGSWQMPPIFRLIQNAAQIDDIEMLRTFNLGIGMVAVTHPANIESVKQIALKHKIDCWTIGCIIDKPSDKSSFVLTRPD